MVALLMLYPGLSAVRLVGTDLVQAVPLVLAAAISNIALNGLDWDLLIPLVVGSVPAPSRQHDRTAGPAVDHPARHRRGADHVRRRAARQGRLGTPGRGETHPMLIAVSASRCVLVPLVWGLLRRDQGLPMFGAPTVAELEDRIRRAVVPAGRAPPAGGTADRPVRGGRGRGRSSRRRARCRVEALRPSRMRGCATMRLQRDRVEGDVLGPLGEQQHHVRVAHGLLDGVRVSAAPATSPARSRSPAGSVTVTWAPCSCICAATSARGSRGCRRCRA